MRRRRCRWRGIRGAGGAALSIHHKAPSAPLPDALGEQPLEQRLLLAAGLLCGAAAASTAHGRSVQEPCRPGQPQVPSLQASQRLSQRNCLKYTGTTQANVAQAVAVGCVPPSGGGGASRSGTALLRPCTADFSIMDTSQTRRCGRMAPPWPLRAGRAAGLAGRLTLRRSTLPYEVSAIPVQHRSLPLAAACCVTSERGGVWRAKGRCPADLEVLREAGSAGMHTRGASRCRGSTAATAPCAL